MIGECTAGCIASQCRSWLGIIWHSRGQIKGRRGRTSRRHGGMDQGTLSLSLLFSFSRAPKTRPHTAAAVRELKPKDLKLMISCGFGGSTQRAALRRSRSAVDAQWWAAFDPKEQSVISNLSNLILLLVSFFIYKYNPACFFSILIT